MSANLNSAYKLITRRQRNLRVQISRLGKRKIELRKSVFGFIQFYTEHVLRISDKDNAVVSRILFEYIAISRGLYLSIPL